jgi:hypothetical protein
MKCSTVLLPSLLAVLLALTDPVSPRELLTPRNLDGSFVRRQSALGYKAYTIEMPVR